MPDLFQLPKYDAAVKRENEIRDAAFLDLATDICGCQVMQMTGWHWIILNGIDSPFVKGATQPPSASDLMMFLWVMSREFWFWNIICGFKNGNTKLMKWRRKRFINRFKKLEYGKVVMRCIDFVRDTFQDSPASSEDGVEKRHVPYFSFAAGLVHCIAGEYHWSRDSILRLPLKEAFQYQKAIDIIQQARCGHNPIVFNPSDAVKRSEIAEIRAEREKNKLHPGQQVSD